MKKLIVGIFLVILLCLCIPIQVEAVNGNTEEFDYVFGKDVPFETTYEFHNYNLFLDPINSQCTFLDNFQYCILVRLHLHPYFTSLVLQLYDFISLHFVNLNCLRQPSMNLLQILVE